MPSNTSKNFVLRDRIAARLKELRSWPPLNHREGLNKLRRPVVSNEVATVFSPVSVAELVFQVTQDWEQAQIDRTQVRDLGLDFETQVSAAHEVDLSAVFVAPKVLEADMGDRDEVLTLYRPAKATDVQYDKFLDSAWNQYLRESQASDDTDAQYLEFLRLKQIYEPGEDSIS
jgi:hypothetical protein